MTATATAPHAADSAAPLVDTRNSPRAVLTGAPLGAVRWRPGFWGDQFRLCQDVTLPHLWKLMDDPETGHALTNLRIAAGEMQGEFAGTHWQDEWVYKWIEAASYIYAVTGDEQLDRKMDEAIGVIACAQASDGYIATQTQVRGWPRFQEASHHEVYVMGHLLTAACAHHRATGKTTLLDVARKTGDFLHTTFATRNADGTHPLAHRVFNPSQIMGLVELYRETGERRYLDAAGESVALHGAEPGGSDQRQDRVALRDETRVVGHMVLATYLYAGATDLYSETGDESLRVALDRLWQDLTQKRMYVHGGIAALHRGLSVRRGMGTDMVWEAAGDDYELPNATAYNETCAQIGNVLWNWRLLSIDPAARYADLMELSMHNSILSGMSLTGDSWFYTNPLRWHGAEHYLHSNDSIERFQPGEPARGRRHVCCPSNLVRMVAGLYGYAYGLSQGAVWLHLYGASEFDATVPSTGRLRLVQDTRFPWDGEVTLRVDAAPAAEVTLHLRIPGWCPDASLRVNGAPVDAPLVSGTYVPLQRVWQPGDTVTLHLPMPVRLLTANPRVEPARNQLAVARGPLIYCLEEQELPAGVLIDAVHIAADAQFDVRHEDALLGGVTVLEAAVEVVHAPPWDGQLYRPLGSERTERTRVRLIPYYAWANRGVGEMTVWLPLSRPAAA